MRALRKEPPKPTTQPLPSLRRAFSLYDQINLIDNVPEDQLRFQGYLFTFSISFLPPISSSFLHYPMWRLKAKALCCIDFQFPSSNFNPCMSRNEISMNIRCLFIYRCWKDTLNYEIFVLGKLAFSWFGHHLWNWVSANFVWLAGNWFECFHLRLMEASCPKFEFSW